MAKTIERTTATLHRRILADIEGRILSGAWQPGDRIPSEQALAAEYGCSRMTMNKALSQLARAGYIERRRRAGSFVRQPQAQSAVLEVHTVASEVESLGLPYRYRLLEQRRHAGNAIARERLDLSESDAVIEIACLHLAGDAPFCLETRLISEKAVPDAKTADFSEESPGAWLLRMVPWQRAEHVIGATGATADEGELLGLAAGSPCLTVERRTWNAERVVTWVRLTYPGDRHALVARFTPMG